MATKNLNFKFKNNARGKGNLLMNDLRKVMEMLRRFVTLKLGK